MIYKFIPQSQISHILTHLKQNMDERSTMCMSSMVQNVPVNPYQQQYFPGALSFVVAPDMMYIPEDLDDDDDEVTQ